MQLIFVNYHYIDDEDKYKSGIYPISTKRLSNQIDLLGKYFEFIGEKELLLALEKKSKLPEKCCVFTFDDGLKNQYDNVLPIFIKKGVPAIFYISTYPYISNKACKVHKIHFLLNKISLDRFLNRIIFYYQKFTKKELNLNDINSENAKLENRYDNNKASLIKYLLNSYINYDLTNKIVNEIFKEYFDNEKDFCEKLYLNKKQIVEIGNNKLFSIGLHTNTHINIHKNNKASVIDELTKNYNYLNKELSIKNINSISYPYGYIDKQDIKKKVLPIRKLVNIKLGLTMNRNFNEDLDDPMFLNRYDTNDVPGGKNPYFNIINNKIVFNKNKQNKNGAY